MKFTLIQYHPPHCTHITGGVLRGVPIVFIAWAAALLIVAAVNVGCGAVPVQWAPPLAGRVPRRHFLLHEMLAPDVIPTDGNGTAPDVCRTGVHLEWSTRVGSSVFASPRIVDLSHDGEKEILVSTYTQFLEALDGVNGEDVSGFPFVHPNFKSYASPLPVDMDGDGKTEWLVAMYTGELMVFGDDGKSLGAVKVPSLPIKKDWVGKNLTENDAVRFKLRSVEKSEEWLRQVFRARRMQDMTLYPIPGRHGVGHNVTPRNPVAEGGPVASKVIHRTLAEVGNGENKDADVLAAPNDAFDDDEDMEIEMDDMLDGDDGTYEDDIRNARGIGTDGWLSAEARASMDLLYHQELYKGSVSYEGEKDAFKLRNIRSPESVIVADDEIAVDPHIMSTPVIADVDGNGDLDVVVHLSYFFDSKTYEGYRENLLPEGIRMNDYVADVLVVINLVTGEVKWLKVLHLTTKNSTRPAYAMSSPVVVNSKKDVQHEIYVTTTAGAIFGFTGDGRQLDGWPVWMETPITASVSTEDVDANGVLDICAGDTGGNVACYRANGEKLWSKHFPGAITGHITFGDIDGDGDMDLTFGTASGSLYAVRGRDGKLLPKFPITTGGPILASPLPVNLNGTSTPLGFAGNGLHLVVPSHDGTLYIVSGTTGCVDEIDIGEKSSTAVLADDITGNGKLDLVVGTLSGSIMVFETLAEFHPLKAWNSGVKSTNGFTASEGHVGVFIHPGSRVARDTRGDTFTLLVTIYDKRVSAEVERQYSLTITIGPRIMVHRKVYTAPGTYTITLRAPLERMYASLTVMMLLPNGLKYEDSVAMSFNMHFLESIKLTFLLPFLVTCLALSFVSRRHEVEPPRLDALDF